MPFETNCKVSIHIRGCCCLNVLENFNQIMLLPAIHHLTTPLRQKSKFNLISLSICSKKSAQDTPITRKINFHLFHLPCDLIFFFSAAALLQSLTPNTTLHKTSFWWCRLLLFSLLVPSATSSVYNRAYTERAALEATLWYRISQWFDCKSSVVTRKIYKERAKREEIKIFSFLRSWRYRRSHHPS